MKHTEKSHYFTIYLLKKGFDSSNSLDDENCLMEASAQKLPENAKLYIQKNTPKQTWWSEYWQIEDELEQMSQGAIIFIPIIKNDEERVFALSFGHAYHNLKDIAYEYDFGLRTTLNALDPAKIKSTDMLSPESAKRARIQSPANAEWSFFDFKSDESIIKKLQGVVKSEYENLFKNVSGTASLKFSSKFLPENISLLLNKLLDIYVKEDFKETFPDLQSVLPVNDPDIIGELNNKLLEAFKNENIELLLTIPEITSSAQEVKYFYSGLRSDKQRYDEVYIEHYRNYLKNKNFDINGLSINELLNHQLKTCLEDGLEINSYSIFKCMLFECELNYKHYHLCDGEWYEIDKEFLTSLDKFLDPIFIDLPTSENSPDEKQEGDDIRFQLSFLQNCSDKKEEDYNKRIITQDNLICLDQKFIYIKKSKIEPCDVLFFNNDIANFIHIKISTRSSALSHLFNQGLNSIEFLRSEEEFKHKLKELIGDAKYYDVIDSGKYSIIYGIITPKPKELKARNLPIFSRITLRRTLRTCRLWGINCYVVFINDLVDRKKNSKD